MPVFCGVHSNLTALCSPLFIVIVFVSVTSPFAVKFTYICTGNGYVPVDSTDASIVVALFAYNIEGTIISVAIMSTLRPCGSIKG